MTESFSPRREAEKKARLETEEKARLEAEENARLETEECRGAALPVLAPVEDDAKRYLDAGFMFVAVGADIGLLIKHSDALLKRFKPE